MNGRVVARLAALAVLLAAPALGSAAPPASPRAGPARPCSSQRGFAAIPSGPVSMGADGPDRPGATIRVARFRIAQTETTVAQFAAFVRATGYRTTAERTGFGAVFHVPIELRGDGADNWWLLVKGADWRHPAGPQHDASRASEPVVQVTVADARAYARWRTGRLPSEEEWERAARGPRNLNLPELEWAYSKTGLPRANTWQGAFPLKDEGTDGFAGIAPVGCYDANGFGLFDMIGNVWELATNADGAVAKGGSYLCATNFCANFRPAARLAIDQALPTSHIGFRIVLDH
jgi:sulfatase modifying factor 1